MLFQETHKRNKHAMPATSSSMQIYFLIHCQFKVIEKVLVGLENYFYFTIKFLFLQFCDSNIELFLLLPIKLSLFQLLQQQQLSLFNANRGDSDNYIQRKKSLLQIWKSHSYLNKVKKSQFQSILQIIFQSYKLQKEALDQRNIKVYKYLTTG